MRENHIELDESEKQLVDRLIQEIEIERNYVIPNEADYRMLIQDLEYQKFTGHNISPNRIMNTIDRMDEKYHILMPYKEYSDEMLKETEEIENER